MSTIWTSTSEFSDALDKKNTGRLGAMLLLCSLLLSSCGPISNPFSNNQNTANAGSAVAAAPTATIAPMSPPGASVRPLQPGQSNTQYLPNGLPALQPAHGVNVDQLFADDIQDPIQRIKRVENAVKDLRHDFDAVMPSIVRLVAVEDDMQQLVTQLQTLLRNEPPTANTPAMPAMNAPASLQGTQTAGAERSGSPAHYSQAATHATNKASTYQSGGQAHNGGSGIIVKDLRVGEHPGKTRLVLDVNKATAYRYDVDNSENLLVVSLPQTKWQGTMQKTLRGSPMIASYSVQETGDGGSNLIIQLKKPAKVVYDDTLKPNGTPYYRIVLDVAAQ